MRLPAIFAVLLIGSGASAQVSFTVSSFTPDVNGDGTATLTWSAPSATKIQIRVNSATGTEFDQGANAGTAVTGEWVHDGMLFYLQDVSSGVPGVTLAAITAHAGPPAALTGTPNPFTPNSAGLGLITLNWSAGPDVTATEVRVNSATGTSLTGVTKVTSDKTGQWVNDGMQFYLQNVTHGEPGHTLAVFTAHEALPISGPYLVSVGHQLTYSAPGATKVEIHIDKPWGQLLGRLSGPSGTADTGSWEPDGMRFFLQDVSNGQPLTAQYTLASVIASYPDYPAPLSPTESGSTLPPLPTDVLFGASPDVIPDPGNTGLGATTLFWNAPGYSNLEVHLNAPDGKLFSGSAGSTGTAATGQWVRDGMRFFLQDPSSGTTIGIVTVGLQPATQHYVAFYTSESGLLIFDRDSGDRIGWILPSTFPSGVTPIDLHTSPDGTLIYMMGSDFNYYVLNPATDALVATFSVGSQPAALPGSAAFTFMKGPANQDLLIAAPDANGNVSIVDPALKTVISSVNCQCSGQFSLYYNQFNQAAYFFNPVIGGGQQIAGVTQNLQLGAPISWGPLTTLPMGTPNGLWSLLAVDSGLQGAFVTPNFTLTGQTVYAYGGLTAPIFGIPIPNGAGIYDIQSASNSTASLIPESVSPDGQSVYGRVFTTRVVTLGSFFPPPPDGFCYLSQVGVGGEFDQELFTCYQSISVVRYQLSSAGGAPTFTQAATLNAPAVRPPSAFDDQYAYLIWLNTDPINQGNPISLSTIHKADPLTLQPIPGDNPIPFATPGGLSPPLTGDLVGNILVGAYIYTGTGPSGNP
jgi:hypothetical protein